MAPQDNLEHCEATEAQDLTRLLYALRPSERAVQVPPPVDLTIRAAIWQAPVRRQVITLLSLARRDLVQVIRQALTDNPLLEAGARAEDEHAPPLTAAADDLTEAEERYDSIWQACVPDGWDAHGLPAPADEAPYASEHPSGPPEALVPDVLVTKVGQAYQVVLNEEGIPRLRLSATYRRLVREGQGGEPEATQDLDDKLRAAVWLIRSLEHRRQTLLKVATSLVTWQRDFFDHGLAHLKPLALTEVAEVLGLHASTVRCVITDKYLSTAHGIVALTSFFPSRIASAGGEPRASLTVQETQQRLAADVRTRPQPAWLPGSRPSPLFCPECGALRPERGVPCRACGSVDPTHAIGLLAISDEEQRVRQALAAHARRQHAEPPPQSDREEASGVPLERHVRELQALYEIGQALSSVHDLDHLLQLAMERVVTLLDIESASSILLDEERDELYFKVAYDRRAGHEQDLREVRFPAKQGIAGCVIQEGQSLVVSDVEQDPRWYSRVDAHTGTKTRSIICAPLRTKDRIIGVLEAINKIQGVFTIEDVQTVGSLRQSTGAGARECASDPGVAGSAGAAVGGKSLLARGHGANGAIRDARGRKSQDAGRLSSGGAGAEHHGHTSCSRARAAPARISSRESSIIRGRGPRGRSSPSIARPFQRPCWRPSSSATSVERSPAPHSGSPGALSWQSGGTLFLNEIGDMSPVLQAKLLQVLQDKQFERLGGTETLTTDARIVAATNQDLERLIAEGRFRNDLFYRLNVYPIALPPLRERLEDLGPLTMSFLKRFSQKLRKEVLGISKEAMGLLERYSWPGNVRELENVLERAVILCQGTVVTAQDLPSLREHLRAPVLSGDAFRLPPGGIVLAEVEKGLDPTGPGAEPSE